MSYLHIAEDETENVGVPKPVLIVALCLAIATIVLAGVARVAHSGTLGTEVSAKAVASRALVFSDRPDGSIGVFDATHHDSLAALTGSGGFVRGALRALARQRRLANVGAEVPFYLSRWSDGRLTLDDSATKNHLELRAFGPANADAFAALLAER